MKNKILVIGSTGNLGKKLLNFCYKNNIKISCVTCYKNTNFLKKQIKRNKIEHSFSLSDQIDVDKFKKYLSLNKFDITYFLDYGCESLVYLNLLLLNNRNSVIAVANKELIIAAGPNLNKNFRKNKNVFVPLDSEHFSLKNNLISNDNIKNIFITASGGPFYFKKSLDLNKATFASVINHPKWKMGINNSIDSSNFINKLLEIYELSYIYEINIEKINFYISKNAYIHSLIEYTDGTVTINCYNNEMLIPLIYPLSKFYPSVSLKLPNLYFDNKNLLLEKYKDSRFKLLKYFSFLRKLDHLMVIKFLLLNNKAHELYLTNILKYNDIIPFIISKLKKDNHFTDLSNFNKTLKFINLFKKKNEIL